MQDRWVSYIYRYRENSKYENAGFIKVTRTSRKNREEAKVQIGLKLFKPTVSRCKIYLIHNQNKLSLMDEVLIKPEEKDVISIDGTYQWQNFINQDTTPKDYDGVYFVVDDGDTLVSMWRDVDIDVKNLSVPEKEIIDNQEEPLEEPDIIPIIEMPEEEKGLAASDSDVLDLEDPIDHIMTTHIKLPLFVDSPFEECVKMVPQDIGKLAISNWKLGYNSFLTHGYYRYKYIMLGKLKQNQAEKYIIGVPGVYTNKERYLANMFGFTLFVPVKNQDIKTGNFGYWVWEVLRQ